MKEVTYICVLLLLLCGCVTTIHAQSTDYFPPIENGPRLSFSWVQFPEKGISVQGSNGTDTLTVFPSHQNFDFALGMFMQFNIREYLFFRPEALVHISSRKLKTLTPVSSSLTTHKDRLFAFSLPVVVGYRVEGWSLQAGITWHNQLRNTLKKENDSGVKYEYGNYTTFTSGVGYQKDRLLIDIYYETALSGAGDTVWAGGDVSKLRYKPSRWSLRLGFALGKR